MLRSSGSLPIEVSINILKEKTRNDIQITIAIAGLVISSNCGKIESVSV